MIEINFTKPRVPLTNMRCSSYALPLKMKSVYSPSLTYLGLRRLQCSFTSSILRDSLAPTDDARAAVQALARVEPEWAALLAGKEAKQGA